MTIQILRVQQNNKIDTKKKVFLISQIEKNSVNSRAWYNQIIDKLMSNSRL